MHAHTHTLPFVLCVMSQAGSEDVFAIESKAIGEVTAVTLEQDDSGASSAWFVERVTVRDTMTNKRTVFQVHDWLATDRGSMMVSFSAVCFGVCVCGYWVLGFFGQMCACAGEMHLFLLFFLSFFFFLFPSFVLSCSCSCFLLSHHCTFLFPFDCVVQNKLRIEAKGSPAKKKTKKSNKDALAAPPREHADAIEDSEETHEDRPQAEGRAAVVDDDTDDTPSISTGKFGAVEKEIKAALADPKQLKSYWRQLDFNGNNIVSLAEIDKFVVRCTDTEREREGGRGREGEREKGQGGDPHRHRPTPSCTYTHTHAYTLTCTLAPTCFSCYKP